MEKALTIDSLAYQGYGVGRADDGMVWFVPYTVPGDRITAVSVDEKKSFIFGKTADIKEPSPLRREARCPLFGDCGGCHWQTVDYDTQLKAKGDILTETFKRAGLVLEKPPILRGAPEEFGYRNRIQLRFDENGEPGFYRRESHQLVAVRNCPLAHPALNSELEELWKDSGLSDYPEGVELRLKKDGTVERISLDKRSESEYDFSQVNQPVNLLLQEEIRRAAEKWGPDKPWRVMDLFCGNGNLSLPLLDRSARIRGWDLSAGACTEGMNQAREQGAVTKGDGAQVRYFSRSLEKSSDAILREAGRADLVIVDPPRKGIGDHRRLFQQIETPLLFYVSCSPPTLARDLASLKSRGYILKELVVFDMFPQTYHLETLAVLMHQAPG
jgi:23S rRNA (uracil1939-C5)-methyltransferase